MFVINWIGKENENEMIWYESEYEAMNAGKKTTHGTCLMIPLIIIMFCVYITISNKQWIECIKTSKHDIFIKKWVIIVNSELNAFGKNWVIINLQRTLPKLKSTCEPDHRRHCHLQVPYQMAVEGKGHQARSLDDKLRFLPLHLQGDDIWGVP